MVFQTKGKLSAKTHQLSETERSWWKGPGCPCGEAWESGGLSCCLKEYLYRETEISSHWQGEKSTVILKKQHIYIYSSWNQEQLLKVQSKFLQAGWWGLTVRPHSEARAGERSRSLGDPSGPAAVLFPFQGEPGASAMWMCQPHGAPALLEPLVSPRNERSVWPQVVGGKGPEKRGNLRAHFLRSVLRKEEEKPEHTSACPLTFTWDVTR